MRSNSSWFTMKLTLLFSSYHYKTDIKRKITLLNTYQARCMLAASVVLKMLYKSHNNSYIPNNSLKAVKLIKSTVILYVSIYTYIYQCKKSWCQRQIHDAFYQNQLCIYVCVSAFVWLLELALCNYISLIFVFF